MFQSVYRVELPSFDKPFIVPVATGSCCVGEEVFVSFMLRDSKSNFNFCAGVVLGGQKEKCD